MSEHPSEHPDYPEHFQPSHLKVQMTPKAARDILDFLDKHDAAVDKQSVTVDQARKAFDLVAGASFVLKALGISRNHVKWTAEIR